MREVVVKLMVEVLIKFTTKSKSYLLFFFLKNGFLFYGKKNGRCARQLENKK